MTNEERVKLPVPKAGLPGKEAFFFDAPLKHRLAGGREGRDPGQGISATR